MRELLVAGNRKVYEILVATDLDDAGVISDIVDLAYAARVPVQEVNRNRLEAMARSEAPQGILAKAAALPEAELDSLLRRRPGRPPFLVAVDGVTDPGNLGAIVRSADGAGATGVVLPRHRAVHVTPTVAKASAGAIEHVPMAVVPGIPAALADQGRRDLGRRPRRRCVEELVRARRSRGGGDLSRPRSGRYWPLATGTGAMRRHRAHPDARSPLVVERLGGRVARLLRGRSPPRLNGELPSVPNEEVSDGLVLEG